MNVGPYRLIVHQGPGQAGDWYEARDDRDGRAVRLLVRWGESIGDWDGVARRLRLIPQLRHEAMVSLVHLDLDGPTPYAAWDIPPERSLGTEIRSAAKWPERTVLGLGFSLAGILADAHRLGLMHGRVAPSEIYLDGDSAVLDFAHVVEHAEDAAQTMMAPPVSPQPIRPANRDENDPSIDVFNLGVILHRLVHGRDVTGPIDQSFLGDSFEVTSLQGLIDWMLASDPDLRPTASETAACLQALREQMSHRKTRVRPDQDKATPVVGYAGDVVPPTTKSVGRYRLLKQLGEGGLGMVYLARDSSNDRQVAVKILHRRFVDSPRIVRRFKKEARLLAEIQSPHVCRLLDFNEDAGHHYLVMEYLQGQSLGAVIERRVKVPETLALAIIADAARALAEAHRRGIIHRDIKPDNIMLVGSWSRLSDDLASGQAVLDPASDVRVKLCDFGMARHIEQSASLDMTQTGFALGTPLYISPEQANGEAEISFRSDVYSLGATLFHLLTGRPPFEGKTVPAIIAKHVKEAAPSPRAYRSDLSDAVAQVVLKTMAKDPMARYADAEELLRELERLLRGEPTDLVVHPRLPSFSADELLSYDWSWDLSASAADLWPFVSNTERLNQAVGIPAVSFSLKATASLDSNLGTRVDRFGTFRKAGVVNSWREHAYEWVEGRRMCVLREYSEGVFLWLASIVELHDRADGGTTLHHRVRVVPRGRFGRIVAALEVGFKGRRNVEAVYRRIDKYLAQSERHDPAADAFLDRAAAPVVDERTRHDLVDRLVRRGVDVFLGERLVDFFLRAPEQEIARIRPIALARRLRRSADEVIDACLIAAHEGMLVALWDILCPKCRIPASIEETLRTIRSHSQCEACHLDFELDFTNSVELVFRVHSNLRTAETGVFCIGGPAHSPHVVAQVRVAPEERLELTLPLTEGSYQIRGPQLPYAIDFRVHPEARATRSELLLNQGPDRDFPRTFRAGAVRMIFRNEHTDDLVVRVERSAPRTDALTAARASSLARFRDLFPGETLSGNQLVSIAHVTLLTTAANDVSKIYKQGDVHAFGVLHEHFRMIEQHVRKESGALVKTVRDGVVAVFHDAAAAVRVALDLQPMMERSDATRGLKLRIGVHSGPALAATINDKLDYFGATVNLAMTLPSYAAPGEIVLSHALTADAQVHPLLTARGLSCEVLDDSPPETPLHRLALRSDVASHRSSPVIIKLPAKTPAS